MLIQPSDHLCTFSQQWGGMANDQDENNNDLTCHTAGFQTV